MKSAPELIISPVSLRTVSKAAKAELMANTEGETPPPFWYAVFRGSLGRTQYATIPLNRTQRSFFKSFSVITDENITQRLKTRDWQINNVNRSQWYD